MRKDPNCITTWFPLLEATGVPVPRTILLEADLPLTDIFNHESEPKGLDDFIARVIDAGHQVGWPCFIRSGHGSYKHDWVNSCLLQRPDHELVKAHVLNITEWCCTVDMVGLPTTFWAVRKLLDVEVAFRAFNGVMPISRERRYFIEDGKVVCHHPYWPRRSIQDPDDPDWVILLDQLNYESPEEVELLTNLSKRVSAGIPGFWSLDWLWVPSEARWYAIDMAQGHRSYHWETCPNMGRTAHQPDYSEVDHDQLLMVDVEPVPK